LRAICFVASRTTAKLALNDSIAVFLCAAREGSLSDDAAGLFFRFDDLSLGFLGTAAACPLRAYRFRQGVVVVLTAANDKDRTFNVAMLAC
jgi:hypothetical protein